MHVHSRLRMPILLLATLAFGACKDNNGPTSQNQSTQPHVTVRLTDAAGDVKAAVVTISEINLQGGPNGQTILLSTRSPPISSRWPTTPRSWSTMSRFRKAPIPRCVS